MHARLRILHIGQLVQVVAHGEQFLCGETMNRVEVIRDGGIVVGDNGCISMIGQSEEIEASTATCTFDADLRAPDMCVLPGFVDAHSHPVWVGDRCHEFCMKLAGASYMDIHEAGGGIGYTAKCVQESSEEELLESLLQRLDRMLAFGTTTLEAKSGYGLQTEHELKLLRVLHTANKRHTVDIVSTFLGAHSIPKGMTSSQATDIVVEQMIPAVLKEREAGLNSAENIDVFCETGVFAEDETQRILQAGTKAGFHINFHGDELTPMHAGELAGKLGALAVSHLECVTSAGIAAMAARPTFAVLLPSTAYVLHLRPPPARKMIQHNLPVALGSDFCPNAHCMSIPMVMNFACVTLGMTANEALVASTINSAASINRSDRCGSLEVGKWGDVVLLNAPRWEHVLYQMVDPPIEAVFKMGRIAWRKQVR